jgi:hypothetical protein
VFARRSGVVLFAILCGLLNSQTGRVPVAAADAQALDVIPVYEGWERRSDGTINMVFGYFNRNWDTSVDIPIGENNTIEPGGPDRGQPTRFMPRRSFFLFKVQLPADFGDREVVWTLNVNGKPQSAYGTLKPGYFLDDLVISMNHGGANNTKNVAPSLTLMGKAAIDAHVGQPITLTASATDDGIPATRALPPLDPFKPGGLTIQSAMGLRLAWFVYRGPGDVVFDPPQFKTNMDMREGSPWTPGWQVPAVPPNNTWVTRATFKAPGTYVLRCLAHDGALPTYRDVTVTVR